MNYNSLEFKFQKYLNQSMMGCESLHKIHSQILNSQENSVRNIMPINLFSSSFLNREINIYFDYKDSN